MSDSVRFIFVSLLKVPIIIFVSFFILNLYGFAFNYFRMLGISYVVMQTAVENNYIPEAEYTKLSAYITDMDAQTEFVDGAQMLVNDATEQAILGSDYDPTVTAAHGLTTSKRQYGKTVKVGVFYYYTVVWPLSYQDANGGKNVEGLDGANTYDATKDPYRDGVSGDTVTGDHRVTFRIPVKFFYTVPGLKYYPDLNSNS